MSQIKSIIFDWAGTTVDFGCFAPVNVFIDIFREAGIGATIEEAREPMGMLKRDHIEAMLEMPNIQKQWEEAYGRKHSEADIDALYQQFETQLMENLATYTDPLPGVVNTVAQLRNQGYAIGSTTGYTREMMETVSQRAKEKGYEPDVIVTAEDVGDKGRPYPYMIFENMRRLQAQSVSEVVKVGDTTSDMKEAVNSGVTAVGVIQGSSIVGLSENEWANLSDAEKDQYRKKATQVFRENGADYVIDTISELPELLTNIE